MPENSFDIKIYNDYAQSANTLFHFMDKSEYLKSILINRAIVPRYCMENIEYLNIHNGDLCFKEVAILQKCFCDIPIHKLTDKFELLGVGKAFSKLTDVEKNDISKNNTHPDFYGKFGIAFSKEWGEIKNLQPVHYLNENSFYTKDFAEMINNVLSYEDILDNYSNDIFNRLSFIKPLRGIMKRTVNRKQLEIEYVEFYKNFHDEQEWRYVPEAASLSLLKLERIIANPKVLQLRVIVSNINKGLATEKYSELWLKYNYDEIRYIIVPDLYSRIEMINTIISIPDYQFNDSSEILLQKYIMISKILVLEEIRKDT